MPSAPCVRGSGRRRQHHSHGCGLCQPCRRSGRVAWSRARAQAQARWQRGMASPAAASFPGRGAGPRCRRAGPNYAVRAFGRGCRGAGIASAPANRRRESFPSSQSPLEVRPPSPEGAVVAGNHDIRFSVARRETAMSKGRAEAAAGAPSILLRYLEEQNRPYSAQDVFGNLQREHGLSKAAVVKTLEQLAQQGRVREKTYGKQKVYFANQDQFDTVSDADLQSLDAKILALTAKVQGLQQSCRHMEAGRRVPCRVPARPGSLGQELRRDWVGICWCHCRGPSGAA
ncbi:homologous-pairing protein 2 homolog isoform X2 [Heterocephalus glaber]|uniref:Homologous-pairing protein 2 homolog n=1 Tax=Heterocephalus glaber TaxID=10181 RepID=A0AAX6RGI6_HETGA|nr:homologous-pairing protein 2 homolog isoform X2 [Heterocephalus glaber]